MLNNLNWVNFLNNMAIWVMPGTCLTLKANIFFLVVMK